MAGPEISNDQNPVYGDDIIKTIRDKSSGAPIVDPLTNLSNIFDEFFKLTNSNNKK